VRAARGRPHRPSAHLQPGQNHETEKRGRLARP
jgi:hypothetical protein